MLILGIDFETTGIDVARDRVVEIGYCLWDVERKTAICVGNQLVRHEAGENVVLSEEIQALTGILPADLQAHGTSIESAFAVLCELMERADFVIAHNGTTFDKPIYEAEMKRLGWDERARAWARPWIDTCTDVPYPPGIRTRKLSYLAAEHRIMNPFPHRAVFDVLTMLQLLAHYNFAEVAELAKSPMICIQAMVSYEDREKAKERGFRWDKPGSRWVKDIKETHFARESAEAGFPLVRL